MAETSTALRRLFVLWLILTVAVPLAAREGAGDPLIPELEFRNEDISAILSVLGHAAGKTILPDATVRGRSSFYFRNQPFSRALAAFAEAEGLFLREREGAIFVSRARVVVDSPGRLSVSARGAPLESLLEKIDAAVAVPVLQAGVDRRRTRIHVEDLALPALLEALLEPHPDLAVLRTRSGYVVRPAGQTLESAPVLDVRRLPESADRFHLRLRDAGVADVLRRLFREAEQPYLNLADSRRRIPELTLDEVSLEEAVTAVALAGGVTVTRRRGGEAAGGRWVVLEGRSGSLRQALRATTVVPLEHRRAETVLSGVPRELAGLGTLQVLPGENALAVTGLAAEVAPVLDYLATVDRLPRGTGYRRFPLVHMEAAAAHRVMPARLSAGEAIILEDMNVLLVPVTPSQERRLRDFLARIDVAPEATEIRLRHVPGDIVLQSLPPEIPRRYLQRTGEPGLLLFSGPDEVELRLRELVAALDVAPPQLRYDLLIVQYQEGKSVDYRLSVESVELRPLDTTLLLGKVGDLLSLSADLVSLFGHRFALSLSSALSNKEAQVLADTSVTALSGTPVSFRNTETYRYRDLPLPAGGEGEESEAAVGVTREITSGLFIDIDGRVVGPEEIALEIAATVSKRGRQVSETGGNPPATSERVVTSSLRAQSGRPIVVGSFLLRDESESLRRVPILGQIPVLGWLFRGLQSSAEESELVVYLVPRILRDAEEMSLDTLLSRLDRARRAEGPGDG